MTCTVTAALHKTLTSALRDKVTSSEDATMLWPGSLAYFQRLVLSRFAFGSTLIK